MTASMKALYRRAWLRLKSAADGTLELKSQPEHRASCLAWRDMTGSARCEGTWKGPGRYSFDGYSAWSGTSVATVEWKAPPAQMELSLERRQND